MDRYNRSSSCYLILQLASSKEGPLPVPDLRLPPTIRIKHRQHHRRIVLFLLAFVAVTSPYAYRLAAISEVFHFSIYSPPPRSLAQTSSNDPA